MHERPFKGSRGVLGPRAGFYIGLHVPLRGSVCHPSPLRPCGAFVLGADLCLDTLVTLLDSLVDRRRFLAVAGAAAAVTASGVQASPLGALLAGQAVQPPAAGKARFRTGLV